MSPTNASINPITFQSIFEHVSMGIIVVDDLENIQKINPYTNHLFGYHDNELIGEKIEILIPANARHNHASHRDHYHQKPTPRAMGIGMDLKAVRKDGTEFPVEISLASYEMDGKRQIVSFISDITARKKAEDAIKKLNSELELKVEERTKELSHALLELHHINEDLKNEIAQRKRIEDDLKKSLEKEKDLSELKSRFVSMASHEFRTPLAGILSSADLISHYETREEQERRERHINTIKTAVKNLTSILNDFLSLDKLEGGKIACRPSRFSFRELCDELVQEMLSIAKKDQKIIENYEGENDSVFLDKDMLHNVLINLVSNATKYSPENTTIKLNVFFHPEKLIISIKDQGIGIPSSDQKHLFEKFFRANNVTTIQGTGLGLNIIKRYLDLMNGSIEFTSKIGQGTTFTVTLPREVS